MARIKFYLRNCSDPNLGILNHWVLEGQKVLQRKSYGIKLPTKYWDVKNGRLKRSHPEHLRVNKMIEDVLRNFDYQESIGGFGNIDEQCVLLLFEKSIRNNGNTKDNYFGSNKKYNTILENLREVTKRVYKSDKLPIKWFREIETINTIKRELLISRKTGKNKKFKTLKNYLYRVAKIIDSWNKTSGTQFPINTEPLIYNIGKDEETYVRAFEKEELRIFEEYQPKGHRGAFVEQITKSLFLFQYWSGGTRIHDAILFTNKRIQEDLVLIRNRKQGIILRNPITFKLAQSIEFLYPDLFKKVYHETRMSTLKIPVELAVEIARLEYPVEISKWNHETFKKVGHLISQKFPLEYNEIRQHLKKTRCLLEAEIGKRFFKELALLEEQFIFPYLKYEEFDGTELKSKKFTEIHEAKIQRVRAKVNGALKRICKNLGIEPISSHGARHSIARNMVINGVEDVSIQYVLGHRQLSTTQHYLYTRHPLRFREINTEQAFHQLPTDFDEQ
jgi:integrase